ncbi:MAG TPA: protein kinase [Kofleriaceae bacterium]
MLPERSDALVGSMLGKDYRVLQPIGSGGMAVVYLVEHQTLLKRFAAKVLSTELASSAEARARFTQEAHAASQLDHENIVSISDFGITPDQRPFFVMELLRGQTLDQRLGDGPMSIEEVVAVSVPVARALAHAHAERVIHRDVKPENIFLVQRSQGRWTVKVVDFGIAKTPVNPRLTQTKPELGETLGSPLFMAPEMIRGEDESVDPRSDIYSFGVLLYLMLCGRLPFYDENLLKVMQMHLSLPVPPPQTINPALSAELAAVVERALAKRREDRYPSMEALLLDLEAALPPGSDRLLIEAQSGTALGDTPFAAALSVPRTESQRTTGVPVSGPMARQDAQRQIGTSPSGPFPRHDSLRTMRVAPLRSPADEPRSPEVRALTPRRLAIVVSSALVTGLLGAVAWTRITERRGTVLDVAATPSGAGHEAAPGHEEVVPARPVPAPAAASPLAAVPAPVTEPPAAPPGASSPTTEPRAPVAPPAADRPGVANKKPVVRPRPLVVRRDPPRPVRRVALATPAGGAAGGHGPPGAGTSPADADATPATPSSGGGTPGGDPASPFQPAPPAPTAPVRPSPPAGPGSLDATLEVATLEVKGSLAASVVKRGLERHLGSLRACYQAAARAGNATPAIDLQVTFEIDENSGATHVTTGGASLGSLASCAAGVIAQVHTQQAPDVGTAQVLALIRFRPS